jgi:hypothetical protein
VAVVFVASDKDRDQLVAKLRVAEQVTVVAGAKEPRGRLARESSGLRGGPRSRRTAGRRAAVARRHGLARAAAFEAGGTARRANHHVKVGDLGDQRTSPGRSRRQQHERGTTRPAQAALTAVIDSLDELCPLVIACVETFPPAIRSTVLQERLAADYSRGREAGHQMLTRAFTERGLETPTALAALPSVIISLCDGLMLQWPVDPAPTPSAAQVIDALAALAPLLAPSN